ncbi:uncharacterized protein [Dysidea avara]|uniref:uncharacterized protein n=1 Tax=Dysidea avara TaxID=196820 RepID=UPI003318EEA9
MKEKSSHISQTYPHDSFQRMFWDAQLREANLKNSKNIMWDPLIIQWCLYLRHLSSSAYEMLRESGVITLPSQRTLRDYTYYTKATTGFSTDVDAQLMQAANPTTCKEWEKHVAILMDEMHIKEDLVYDKHTGAIIGFTNLGEVNSHLSAFENASKTDDSHSLPLANSMLVLLVRGLFTKLNFPYAQFPCTALTGDQMYEPLWEAIGRLELCGLKVMCLTCDGLAANRRLFRLHDPTCKTYIYKTINPICNRWTLPVFYI